MRDSTKALTKLKQYMAEGRSYYQATEQLRSEGFTNAQIDDASSALKSNRNTVADNPELAENLLSVNQELEESKQRNKRRQGAWMPNTAAPSGMTWLPSYVTSWWWIALPFLIIIAAVVLISKALH